MAYVISQYCCKDGSCIPVCPVDCIRPVGSSDTEMLYIDPQTCIDCGACMEECPVDAIHPEDELPNEFERFRELNARYFEQHPLTSRGRRAAATERAVRPGALRVAVVGSGPAGCYVTNELLNIEGAEVTVFDRLPTPFGLVRAGVAPDHQHTKSIATLFERVLRNRRVTCLLNVEVGRDVDHADLMAHHDAVVYAVGASKSKPLGIPGEDLPGSHAAAHFVGWYNGHPDHAHRTFDLAAERAVIIGNGNVALDVARILLADPETLQRTDIAEHALAALTSDQVREVVIISRRGPRHAAFSAAEFMELGSLPDVDIIIDSDGLEPSADDDVETVFKLELARRYAERTPSPANKRLVFRFATFPQEILGDTQVSGLRIGASGDRSAADNTIHTSLVFSSVGYRGRGVADVPFDQTTGLIPNEGGRVCDDSGRPIPGVYVAGWIKRGPQGVIGTNRGCAEQTVASLWQDFDDGLLTHHDVEGLDLEALMAQRGATPISWAGWQAIDDAERHRGANTERPRVKLISITDMLAVVQNPTSADRSVSRPGLPPKRHTRQHN